MTEVFRKREAPASRVACCLLLSAQLLLGQAEGHLQRGAAHLQRNEKEHAIRELKQAVGLDPRSAAAHMLLGQAYLAQGAFEMIAEAKGELQQALDLDPTLVWARFYLAKIYLDLGRTDRAKEELERGLRDRPNVPHLLSLLGEVNRRLGSTEEALALNRRALEADPAMTPAHYHLALAYLDQKKPDDAARELEQALRAPYVIPEMYVALAGIYLDRGKPEAAAELSRKAIALDPSRPEGRLKLADAYRRQKAYDRALEELDRATPSGRRLLSSPYFQQIEAEVHFETGRVYQDQGKIDQAIQAYTRALEVDPSHDAARRQLGGIKKAPPPR